MFYFLSEMFEQDLSLFMGSLDINLSFEIIPFEETINICVNSLCQNTKSFECVNKNEFRQLLHLTINKSPFLFNETLYQKVNKVVMGSSLEPTLAKDEYILSLS